MFVEDDKKLDKCAHAKPGAINLIKGRAVRPETKRARLRRVIRTWRQGKSDDMVTYIVWIPFASKRQARNRRTGKKKNSRVNCPCRGRRHREGKGSQRDYGKNNAALQARPGAPISPGRERSIIYYDLKWHRVLQRLFCCSAANYP